MNTTVFSLGAGGGDGNTHTHTLHFWYTHTKKNNPETSVRRERVQQSRFLILQQKHATRSASIGKTERFCSAVQCDDATDDMKVDLPGRE